MIEIIIIEIINVLTLLIGVKIGMSVANKKEITLNPVKAINQYKENVEKQKAQSLADRKTKTMLDNIDKYDGTSLGQQDIPTE